MPCKLGLGMTVLQARVSGPINLSFRGSQLPSGVTVVGSSLVSGFGPNGLIAWPVNNLISPATGSSFAGWSGSNSGGQSGGVMTIPNSNSTYSKFTSAGIISTAIGEMLAARAEFKAEDAANIGKTFNFGPRNNATGGGGAVPILTADYVSWQGVLTAATAESNLGMRFSGTAADRATAFRMRNGQLYKYPISPDRYITSGDVSSPYDAAYAELFDHFQTTGVRRGLRVLSGVDTATYNAGIVGIYDVTYYWLDTDEVTELSQTVTQYATGGILDIEPPVGNHVLRISIAEPLPFTLNDFSTNGLVFGVSGGGAAGAGASAPIRLSGTAPIGSEIEARVRQGGSTIVDWHSMGTTTTVDWDFKTDPVPRGENYVYDARIASFPAFGLTGGTTFHCRDLIIGTGSSNMANGFTDGGSTARTSMETEFKLHNGNQTVHISNYAAGGTVILGTEGDSNTWYWCPGGTASAVDWEDFLPNPIGQNLEDYLTEIGGEVTAFMNASGGNDTGYVDDAEAQRVYKIAQSRKFMFARSLAGRDIPFVFNEVGIKRLGASVGPDFALDRIRRTQLAMVGEYAAVYLGGVMWDQPLADGQHLADYDEPWVRNARVIAQSGLGYVSGLQLYGPFVASAVRSGNVITVQVDISRGGTDITPSSGITGFRVTDNGTIKTLDNGGIVSVVKGTPVGNLVPVVITCNSLTGTGTVLDYRPGDGLVLTTATDVATINPLLVNTMRDNGSEALPGEYCYQMVVT